MQRAIELARRVQGTTSPNPPVGAVLVREGRVVGEGATQPPGSAHAEIVALRQAGDAARGATLFVTLEPCSHWGRTPPCAPALVRAGVAGVNMSLLDPNPQVSGAGRALLEQHGIPTSLGELAAEAAELIEAHAKFARTGLPFVTMLVDAPDDVTRDEVSRADVIVRACPENRGLEGSLTHGRAGIARDTTGESVEQLVGKLGRSGEATGVILVSDPVARESIPLAEVDKIVAGCGVAPPPSFVLAVERDLPAPHRIFYPLREV